MKSVVLQFNKIERKPDIIEQRINEVLEGATFKLAIQSESVTKGKLNLTLFLDEKAKGNVRVKAFRDSRPEAVEQSLNEFLQSGVDVKYITQSSSTGQLTLFVFYSPASKKGQKTDGKEESKQG